MNRRSAIGALGALIASAAVAQQSTKVWRVGFLAVRPRPASLEADSTYGEFLRGMNDLGYVEGRNLSMDWYFADADYERVKVLAARVAKSKPDVIVTHSTPATKALQEATRSIPIVSATMGDPVASGFAESLARPGRNVTGFSMIFLDASAKQLELLKAFRPASRRIGYLLNPDNSITVEGIKSVEAASRALGVASVALRARTAREVESAFASMRPQGIDAVLVGNDSLFVAEANRIADLALKHSVATAFSYSDHVRAGGLLSYGEDLADIYRRTAGYVDRILKGAKAGELAIEQRSNPQLVVNLKTAQALGLQVPAEVLLRADQILK